MDHLDTLALEAGLDDIRRSPVDEGRLELIVRRPAEGEREILAAAELDGADGLAGDTWRARGSRSMTDGSADPERQLTLMNARCARLVAGGPDRRPLAGDQLYVDLDIGVTNLPAGSRLALGSAIIEITAPPHTGCQKFTQRFGLDALHFVNSPVGKELRLRGAHARVVVPGTIRVGDTLRKLPG